MVPGVPARPIIPIQGNQQLPVRGQGIMVRLVPQYTITDMEQPPKPPMRPTITARPLPEPAIPMEERRLQVAVPMAAGVLPRLETGICMREKTGTYIKIQVVDGRKQVEAEAGPTLLLQKQLHQLDQVQAMRRRLKCKMRPVTGNAVMPVQVSGVVAAVVEPAMVAVGAVAAGVAAEVVAEDSVVAEVVLEVVVVSVAVVLAAAAEGDDACLPAGRDDR